MICQHPSWLCPRCNRLKINTFWNVYEKNEWGIHFWNNRDHCAVLYSARFRWKNSSVLSAWVGCNVFKWRLNLFGFMLSAANIFVSHRSQWSQALVSSSPSLSACLIIPVKYFFMVSLEGLLHFVSSDFIQCKQKQNNYPSKRIIPVHTLPMRAPLPPNVVEVQLHFSLAE